MLKTVLSAFFILTAQAAAADYATIKSVRATQKGGLWSFTVTISHEDRGWEHFSDAWRVVDKTGKQIAIRELIHPHVDEQPLTRSLSGIDLPDNMKEVGIQVRDTVGGWNPEIKRVPLK